MHIKQTFGFLKMQNIQHFHYNVIRIMPVQQADIRLSGGYCLSELQSEQTNVC
jgi:hypothetical protein